jgi:hypothetical protein
MIFFIGTEKPILNTFSTEKRRECKCYVPKKSAVLLLWKDLRIRLKCMCMMCDYERGIDCGSKADGSKI